ncbi:MAG: amino acid adenylation domain-containing protein [Variovorax sp.]|nr:amino acid adenylation domain-containing protein [Variovorax sp.]
MDVTSDPTHPLPEGGDIDMALVRRRLLARKLQQQQRALAASRHAAAASQDAPLSFAQEGLWFLDLLAAGSAAYNIHSVTRLAGPLDAARLEQALRSLIARHASLRTSFHATEDGPVQRVMRVAEAMDRFRMMRADAAAGGGSASDASIDTRIAASVARPFDLSHAPLLRAELLHLGPDHHVLVLVIHHIVADGWSMSIIHRELARLYARGDGAAWPEPALDFAEHARLQRERFERGEMDAALDYWRAKLQGLQTLRLPTDRPHPPQAGSAGRTLTFHIDDELTAAVKAFARSQDATLFMALLAAFQALLMRYTGQDDIAVGVPLAGREDPRVRDVVGFFVNTLVLRAELGGEPSYTALVQRSRQAMLEALTHQAMPFDRLVSELSPVRDASRNPLYQVSFALENFDHRVLQLEGLGSERLGVHSQSAKFDFSLCMTAAGDGLEAEIEYRTDLFDAQTIERMAAHFRRLLAAMVAQPECAVARLPLLSEAERQRLLVEWNDSARPLASELPAHVHVRNQALRTPEAVALRFGRETMTYGQLEALSQQLALTLRAEGAGPGAVVGVCMKRGFGLVVAMLAVFKSAAALLPLDPDHPPDRLRAMLADAAPMRVLAQAPFGEVLRRLDALPPGAIAEVPADGGEMPRAPLPPIEELSRPDHLAYLVYTSGSTGTPKAAQLTHRGLSNHVLWMNEALRLAPQDRVLQKTSISFDASLWEFLSTLSSGAGLVLAPPDAQRDMSRLAEAIREHGITVVQFVPSEMRVILDEPALRRRSRLRWVLSGGEALDSALARAFRQALPGVTLGNFYGPSEATVDSAWYELGEHVPQRRTVPIGRPIANAQLYVLDAWGEPQPVNVAGELYVGGAGVGLGYLNRPAESAAAFVPNPFRPGERMYRTGDLARWLNDGVVEFIGRSDHQVKLRGFRIELGEIEAALHACPGVRAAAAALREDLPGHKELVAYVVAADAAQPDADALRAELKARLPDYMVPAVFVFLPELPQLPSGKIDRRRLPRPEPDAASSDRVGPRSPIEAVLLETWQAVLGRSGFGVRNNFFDLGGHSLLATQIVSRVGAAFKIELPVRSLFEHPTIEALARVVKGRLDHASDGDAAAASPIAIVSRAQPAVVSFSQRRMWALHEMDPQGAAYNMREALRMRGPLRLDVLRPALDELVARHEAFRTTFELADTEPVAIIGRPRAANLIEVDGRAWPAGVREERLDSEARRLAAQPFDLQRGPLHRFVLIRLGDEDHALVLVMHHIIGDAWSWGILLRELQLLYRAGVHGKAPPPPAAGAIDFIDYAHWQRRHIGDEVLGPQVRYWLRQLAGMSPLALPVDTAAAHRFTSAGARVRQVLPDERLRQIQRFSAQHGMSSFMTLLAAFQWLLSRYCGQDDVAVGTPIAGRTRVEAEEVVGSLINTLVLRCVMQPGQSFRALLREVRETCLAAFTHQDVPLDDLVGYLRDRGQGGRMPEVRVMFNVLNTPHQALALEGLEVEDMPLDLGATQFDLALTIDTVGGNVVSLTYSTELFTAAAAQALLDNYLHLLQGLIEQPDRPMRELPLSSPQERTRLAEWNRTARAFARGHTLNDLLARHCGIDAMAVIQRPGDEISYAQLWSSVHRLVHRLRRRGIHRGQRVGLCLPRDPGMVVALLAVLRAGAAYVPLDPAYPEQRLHDMAQHAGLALLLTRGDLADRWQGVPVPRLLLDEDAHEDAPGTPPPPDAERDARPEDPAYVIYTSGSTGRPKGVVVPHGAVVNFLQSMRQEPGLRKDDVLVAVTTLSFDIAVLELLLPLAVGAAIVLAHREQATDGAALRALLEQSGATAMQATPSTWQMLIDAGWNGGPGFKALIGGESLSAHMAQALSARAGELWNMYGPTETTVWSTCWRVPAAPGPIAIGRPIANTTVHVLDAAGQPCPVGCSGEIFIGGDGVALGYLHQPELTAERFVPDPFSPRPGARLYKTGDRGRWRHDGLLEHQGRLDFQVKVRGHRIEPGEIEAQLRVLPEVAQCLVMAREDRPGDVRLVAYVVAAPGAAVDSARLKDHLRSRLPDYMVPQHCVALAALPLLPNGKIDRHALPAPVSEARVRREIRSEARTPAEAALANVWAEVLGLDAHEIDPRDNFFDLGGDSLKAGRTVIHFERTSGVRLETQRLIFETLAQMARGIELSHAPVEAPIAEPAGDSWLKRLFKGRS